MKELDSMIVLYIMISLLLIIAMGIELFMIKFTDLKYDVNRDGEVSAADYVLIKNYIMSKE